MSSPHPVCARPGLTRTISLLCAAATLAVAAETGGMAADTDLRMVAQLAAGTAGVEPGLALEWRSSGLKPLILRPEVLISEDGRPGVGLAVLGDLSTTMELPARQAFAIGPRLLWHNSDASGWEADAMATWSYELSGTTRPWRHAIGLLGALGVYHDREERENKVGVTGGFFYSFGF